MSMNASGRSVKASSAGASGRAASALIGSGSGQPVSAALHANPAVHAKSHMREVGFLRFIVVVISSLIAIGMFDSETACDCHIRLALSRMRKRFIQAAN
jgi:hypothetical protein